MTIPCALCGALHWLDERLARSSAIHPRFSTCCDQGQVQLASIPPPPPLLLRLLTSQDSDSVEFRLHIRRYNAALSFISLGTRIDEKVNNGRGPYVFRICGELHHLAGSLLPPVGETPSYAQLYIYDPSDALCTRSSSNPDLSLATLHGLQDMLLTHHQYTSIYKHAYEILSQSSRDDMVLCLRFDPSSDRRRYNLPTSNEIAIILPGTGEEVQHSRDIILRKRSGSLERISELHPAYACLHYVLFFPYGTHGWHPNIPLNKPSS
ncbi:hypothetical protein C8Q76DRAFT_659919, partial [Earliella scabrosa]